MSEAVYVPGSQIIDDLVRRIVEAVHPQRVISADAFL
jgi:hypothetical protein